MTDYYFSLNRAKTAKGETQIAIVINDVIERLKSSNSAIAVDSALQILEALNLPRNTN